MLSVVAPVTWNTAVEGVPEITLEPPVCETAPALLITIVPAVALLATTPKSISVVKLIESGTTSVAVEEAVSDDWAKVEAENPRTITAREKILVMFFIIN